MIPKIIHFCWFGGNPLPPLALECIASWRRFLPEYEIWMWKEVTVNGEGLMVNGEGLTVNGEGLTVNDEGVTVNGDGLMVNGEGLTVNDEGVAVNGEGLTVNGDGLMVNGKDVADKVMEFDVDSIPYTEEAYRQRKYAFVSDYARFWILYQYGGIYFDTDVEVIRPMEDIIAKGPFMGIELDSTNGSMPTVAPGLGLACEVGNVLIKELIDYYKGLTFDMADGNPITIVGHTTGLLEKNGLSSMKGIQKVGDFYIYPSEYFCPIHNITKRLHITENTRSIHRYMDSWNGKKTKSWKDKVRGFIPEWMLLLVNRIKH